MLFQQLSLHHFKEFFRNRQWGENLFLKILSLFGFLILAIEFVALGWFGGLAIKELRPNENVIDVYSGWLLFYFFIEFMFRFFTQNLPLLKIQPYLHLNIPKKTLVHFLLTKSILSYFNLFYLLIAIPFGIKNLLLEGQVLAFINWILVSILAVLTFNFLALLLKRTLGVHSISTIVAILISGLLLATYLFQWVDVKSVSGLIFNSGIASTLLFSSLLAIVYSFNFRLQIAHTYIIEESKSEQSLGFIEKIIGLFKTNSIENELITADLKLILRNKRSRGLLALPIVFFALGFFIPENLHSTVNNKMQFIITSLFLLQINFGQVLPSWESTYFDRLMSINISFKTYLRAKYYLLVILALLGLIPLVFTLFISPNVFVGGLCVVVYCVGVNSIAFIGVSNNNARRMEINESAWFKGSSGGGFTFYKFLISLFPLIIYMPFIFFKWYMAGAYTLAFFGLLGIALHRQFLK
jgi:hypothetical protein